MRFRSALIACACAVAAALLAACSLLSDTEPVITEYRHLMRRVVLWQGDASTTGSGNILDLGPATVTTTPGPGESEERSNLASGGQLPIRRTHRVEIPVARVDEARFGQFMARIDGCGDTQLLMMGGGASGAESWAWYEATSLTVSKPPADAGGLGTITLSLQTRVFDAAIGRGDILSMTAWEGASRDSGTGDLVYSDRPGYEGPAWNTDTGAPDYDGSYGAGTATVTIPAPIEGATLSLFAETGSLTGTITFLDWFGDTISSDTTPNEATVPAYTWAIEVEVTSTDARPILEVDASSTALGVRRGDEVADCDSRATAPFWLDVVREGPVIADINTVNGTGDPLTNVDLVIDGNVSEIRVVNDTGSGNFIDDNYTLLEPTDTFTYIWATGSKTVTANSVSYDSNADETTVGIDESINLSETTPPLSVSIPFTPPVAL